MTIRFDTPKFPAASSGNASRPSAVPAEQKPVAQVAFGEALKSGEAAKAFGDSLTARFDEARKDSARQEVEQIRETVKMLKRMMLLLGGSKGLAKQLQQLARSLASASSVLNEAAENTSSKNLADGFLYTESGLTANAEQRQETSDSDAQGHQEARAIAADAEGALNNLVAQGRAESEQATDDDMPPRPGKPVATVDQDDLQRSGQQKADAELLAKTLRELNLLVAAAKAAHDTRDREDRKRFDEIDENLKLAEKNLLALSVAAVPQMSLSIRI